MNQRRWRQLPVALAWMSFLAALAASWAVVQFDLAPLTKPAERLVPLAIPVVLTGAAAVAASRRWKGMVVALLVVMLIVFYASLAVGPLYAPSALALLFATIGLLTEDPQDN